MSSSESDTFVREQSQNNVIHRNKMKCSRDEIYVVDSSSDEPQKLISTAFDDKVCPQKRIRSDSDGSDSVILSHDITRKKKPKRSRDSSDSDNDTNLIGFKPCISEENKKSGSYKNVDASESDSDGNISSEPKTIGVSSKTKRNKRQNAEARRKKDSEPNDSSDSDDEPLQCRANKNDSPTKNDEGLKMTAAHSEEEECVIKSNNMNKSPRLKEKIQKKQLNSDGESNSDDGKPLEISVSTTEKDERNLDALNFKRARTESESDGNCEETNMKEDEKNKSGSHDSNLHRKKQSLTNKTSDSDSDDDTPLKPKEKDVDKKYERNQQGNAKKNTKKKSRLMSDGDSKSKRKSLYAKKSRSAKNEVQQSLDESSSEDDKPLRHMSSNTVQKENHSSAGSTDLSESKSDDDKPLKNPTTSLKKESSSGSESDAKPLKNSNQKALKKEENGDVLDSEKKLKQTGDEGEFTSDVDDNISNSDEREFSSDVDRYSGDEAKHMKKKTGKDKKKKKQKSLESVDDKPQRKSNKKALKKEKNGDVLDSEKKMKQTGGEGEYSSDVDSNISNSHSDLGVKVGVKVKHTKKKTGKDKKKQKSEFSSDVDSNISHSGSDSGDEVKHMKKKTGKEKKTQKKKKKQKSQESEDSESEDAHKNLKTVNYSDSKDKRIIRMKRYLYLSGIRINNYTEVWKGCRSDEERAQKLKEILLSRGMKGTPSVSKCKKLRKKIEKQKEVEELDLGNIIKESGRGLRSSRSSPPEKVKEEATEVASELQKRFARIRAMNNDSDSGSD